MWTGCGRAVDSPGITSVAAEPVAARRMLDSYGLSIRCATQAEPRPTSGSAAQPIITSRRRSCAGRRIPIADAASTAGPGRELTSVCAGQQRCGAPRRNRTGDTILTMNPGRSAVLPSVFAGRGGPYGAKLCAQSIGVLKQHRRSSYGVRFCCDDSAEGSGSSRSSMWYRRQGTTGRIRPGPRGGHGVGRRLNGRRLGRRTGSGGAS